LLTITTISSLKPIGIENRFTFDCLIFLKVEPIFLSKFLIGLVFRIHLIESEVIIAWMIFPFHGYLSSSPHPNAVDFVVSFNSVDPIDSKTVFSEMIDVSKLSVFKVVC